MLLKRRHLASLPIIMQVIIFTGERFGLYQFDIETKAAKEVVEDAVLTLTSHRIVWIGGTGSSKRHVFSLDLR